MFCEADYLTEKRNAALETLGARYLFHPANHVRRKDAEAREVNAVNVFGLAAPPPERMTASEVVANYKAGLARCAPPPMTAADLIAYHDRQQPAMQSALRAFWRTLVSVPHTGRIFEEALAHIHHEEHRHG